MTKEISKGLVVGLTILAIVLFIFLVSYGWVVGSYNTFVVAKQDINTQFSNIKTEYQRRADLFVNLAEVVSSYARFEKQTLVDVTEARASATKISANLQGTKEEQIQQLTSMDSAISRLLLTFEKYPELKSIGQYNKLFEEIQRTENRVQIARSDYNTLVRSYNILIAKFPKNMLANMFGFYKESFFENEQGTDKSPKIKMGV